MPEETNPTNESEVTLPPDAATSDDQRNPRRRRDAEAEALGLLIETTERHDLARLVLTAEIRRDIVTALRAIALRERMDAVWRLSEIESSTRSALNFYGPPGTGKTRVALAIAHRLGRPLLQVDYSAIISKYLGDTAKHLVRVFREATEAGAVLLFDEADSMLSRRVNMDQSCATSINQNRNVLMQELDRFQGVVIFTTNLFGNYDEALLRRIGRHIRFQLPNRRQRTELFRLHLPAIERVDADLSAVAEAAKGLSGGDIKNACVNAMFAASAEEDPERWRVTDEILTGEVEKVRAAKRDHSRVAVGDPQVSAN
jgi:SpoVK/Ycf46/Vps4 family AAA+-type ATPase